MKRRAEREQRTESDHTVRMLIPPRRSRMPPTGARPLPGIKHGVGEGGNVWPQAAEGGGGVYNTVQHTCARRRPSGACDLCRVCACCHKKYPAFTACPHSRALLAGGAPPGDWRGPTPSHIQQCAPRRTACRRSSRWRTGTFHAPQQQCIAYTVLRAPVLPIRCKDTAVSRSGSVFRHVAGTRMALHNVSPLSPLPPPHRSLNIHRPPIHRARTSLSVLPLSTLSYRTFCGFPTPISQRPLPPRTPPLPPSLC